MIAFVISKGRFKVIIDFNGYACYLSGWLWSSELCWWRQGSTVRPFNNRGMLAAWPGMPQYSVRAVDRWSLKLL